MRAILLIASLALVSGCPRQPAPIDAGDGGTPSAGLVLRPEESSLVSIDGATPRLPLRVIFTAPDGTSSDVTAESWEVSEARIGGVEGATSTFVATGRAGGRVDVTARYRHAELGLLTAHATVEVRVEFTMPPDPGIPPSVIERLETLPTIDDPFSAASIEYPLEDARMPNNVVAPVIQWHARDGAGDGYRIVLEGEHVRVVGYAYDDGVRFRSSWPVDAAAWRIVADSTRGAEVTIHVDRLTPSGTSLVRSAPVTVWLSEDGIFGTLYYWQVRVDPQASDVLRLDAASGVRESVFDTEPGACVGCHALSTDGRRLAASMSGRALRWVTAFADMASDARPPPELFAPIEPAYHFLSFSPTGDRVLASRAVDGEGGDDTRLFLLDGATGEPLAAAGLFEGTAGYPTWSPDGEAVAWMDGGGDGPRGTTAPTRIVVSEVLEGDAFGAPRVIHDGADLEFGSLEGGVTDARPTWSPDSALLAFAHGTGSVSAREDGLDPPRAGLYLVSAAGGPPTRLDRGMGREGPVDAFWPVFSPFVTEESDGTRLFWLAFYSRADYGNDREGTADTERRQLWVMAIDPARLASGEDPSHPPYWLPGQDTRADDIAALWVPTACRPRGESCSSSSECCSGECAAADPAMPEVLTCRPPTVCRPVGESCDQGSDCCLGLCNLGVCGYDDPM